MKYTEQYFEFPVRIYDRWSVQNADDLEEKGEIPIEGDWIEGIHTISHQEIISWTDFYDSEQGVEGVRKQGYDSTLIWTRTQGLYICTLSREKFKKLLNEYVEKYIPPLKQDISDMLLQLFKEQTKKNELL